MAMEVAFSFESFYRKWIQEHMPPTLDITRFEFQENEVEFWVDYIGYVGHPSVGFFKTKLQGPKCFVNIRPNEFGYETHGQQVGNIDAVESLFKKWLKSIAWAEMQDPLVQEFDRVKEELRRLDEKIDAMNGSPLNETEKDQIRRVYDFIIQKVEVEFASRDEEIEKLKSELELLKAQVSTGERQGVLKGMARFAAKNAHKLPVLVKLAQAAGVDVPEMPKELEEVIEIGSRALLEDKSGK